MRFLASLLFVTALTAAANSVSPQGPATAAKIKLRSNLVVQNAGTWKTVDPGIEYRNVVLERSEPNYSVEFKLIRFDMRQIAPRILHSADMQLKSGDAKTLAQRSGAVAAINANYFDEKGRPLAFLRTATGEVNRNIAKSALYTGFFGVRDAIPFIVHRNDFQTHGVEEALQSGPLLLQRGANAEINSGLGRVSRRAVIGVDRSQKLIVGVTDTVLGGLSFSELQELFSTPNIQLDVSELLNLDGGGSAQLYLKARRLEEFVAGTSEVPVVIGFFRRASQ
jgi:uncharacterized protein YigE (DUF2233 family)